MLGNLYKGIFKVLSEDLVIIELLKLNNLVLPYMERNDDIDDEDVALSILKALHIQRKAKPKDVIENLPIITYYTPGGDRDVINESVYSATFTFDIYTNDDESLAFNIADRITEIFHKTLIDYKKDLISFEGEWISEFESKVSLDDTFCYTVLLSLSIDIDNK